MPYAGVNDHPCWHAKSRGEIPSLSCRSTLAPPDSRARTTSMWPSRHATCRGEIPSLSCRSTLAPLDSRVRTTSVWSPRHARCRGAKPSFFCWLILAPVDSRARTTSVKPPSHAVNRGEKPSLVSRSTFAPRDSRAWTTSPGAASRERTLATSPTEAAIHSCDCPAVLGHDARSGSWICPGPRGHASSTSRPLTVQRRLSKLTLNKACKQRQQQMSYRGQAPVSWPDRRGVVAHLTSVSQSQAQPRPVRRHVWGSAL